MNKEKKVFLDVDGTLLFENEELVRDEVIVAINKLKEAGYHIYLATGRSLGQTTKILKQLAITDGVFANGQMVIENNEIIFDHTLNSEASQSMFDLANKYNVFTATIEKEGMFLNRTFKDAILLFKLRKYSFGGIGLKKHSVTGNYGFWYFAKPKDLAAIAPQIDQGNFNVYAYGDTTLEIMPKGFNKAKGIKYLLKNNSNAYTIAIGDGRNDVEMLETVDLAIAMGNANDQLKSIADYTTKINNDGGLVAAVEYILKETN